MATSQRYVSLFLCYALLLWQIVPSNAQEVPQSTPATGLGGIFGKLSPKQMEEMAFEKTVGNALTQSIPIKLNANDNTFPVINDAELPGGPFNGKPFPLTAENILKPPPGDWNVPTLAVCQEYSVHRPGDQTAYKIEPVQGRQAKLLSTILWRGSIAGKDPSEMQRVEWALSSGVTYDHLPPNYQHDVDQLLPDFKDQLNGSWVDIPRKAYTNVVANPLKVMQALGLIPGLGAITRFIHFPAPPTYDALLQRLGPTGQFALESEQFQAKLQTAENNKEHGDEILFSGQGSKLPPVPPQNGPWTLRAPGVYTRLIVHGGNMASTNELEMRIMPYERTTATQQRQVSFVLASYSPQAEIAQTAEIPSLLEIMGLTVDAAALGRAATLIGEGAIALDPPVLLAIALAVTATGIIGYSQGGQGAQALILLLPPSLIGPLLLPIIMAMSKGGRRNIVPTWAAGKRPLPGESARQFADRACKEQYPPDGDNCGEGQGSERSWIRKWARDKFGI